MVCDVQVFSRSLAWAWALGGAVIIGALVVALLLTREGQSPSQAAEDWSAAALSSDRERMAELSCADAPESPLAVLELTEVALPDKLEAVSEQPTSEETPPTEWTVTLAWQDASGSERDIDVTVLEEDGDLVVC